MVIGKYIIVSIGQLETDNNHVFEKAVSPLEAVKKHYDGEINPFWVDDETITFQSEDSYTTYYVRRVGSVNVEDNKDIGHISTEMCGDCGAEFETSEVVNVCPDCGYTDISCNACTNDCCDDCENGCMFQND